MADYFTHFSIGFHASNPAELAWWQTARDDFYACSEPPEDLDELARFKEVYGQEIITCILESGSLGLEIIYNKSRRKDATIYVTDEGGHGNPHAAGLLIQRFLLAFAPKKVAAFTYASTCSKHRVDGFGGGWVKVDAEDVVIHDAYGDMMADDEFCSDDMRNDVTP